MARVAGVTIPTDKRVVMSLTYIHGVGPTTSKKILSEAEVSEDIRVKDLSEPELKKIREHYDNIPIISIAYDGTQHSGADTRLEAFMHQAKQYVNIRKK